WRRRASVARKIPSSAFVTLLRNHRASLRHLILRPKHQSAVNGPSNVPFVPFACNVLLRRYRIGELCPPLFWRPVVLCEIVQFDTRVVAVPAGAAEAMPVPLPEIVELSMTTSATRVATCAITMRPAPLFARTVLVMVAFPVW